MQTGINVSVSLRKREGGRGRGSLFKMETSSFQQRNAGARRKSSARLISIPLIVAVMLRGALWAEPLAQPRALQIFTHTHTGHIPLQIFTHTHTQVTYRCRSSHTHTQVTYRCSSSADMQSWMWAGDTRRLHGDDASLYDFDQKDPLGPGAHLSWKGLRPGGGCSMRFRARRDGGLSAAAAAVGTLSCCPPLPASGCRYRFEWHGLTDDDDSSNG